MKNIIETMKILFQRVSPDKVLRFYLNPLKETFGVSEVISELGLNPLFSAVLPSNYSMDEINYISKLLSQEWCQQSKNKDAGANVFNVLSHFTAMLEVLEEDAGEPVVNYNRLTEWHHISHILGEDVLATAFLAHNDHARGVIAGDRCFFDWRPVLKNNNQRLKEIFMRGLAENHYHLYGSAPHAQISWIALMNRPMEFTEPFKKLNKKKHRMLERINVSFEDEESSLELLVRKASVLRLALYEAIYYGKTRVDLDKEYRHIFNAMNLNEINMWMQDIQLKINSYLYDYSTSLTSTWGHYDYAIQSYATCKPVDDYKGNTAFSGERELLYRFYLGLYSGDKRYYGLVHLFYAYILIMIQFRGELVQVNNRVGFKNFQDYQDIKFDFILSGSIYERLAISMATTATLKNQPIMNFEARITPKPPHELYNTIFKIDKISTDLNFYKEKIIDRSSSFQETLFSQEKSVTHLKELFYNIHFIKREDRKLTKPYWTEANPRNAELRTDIKEKALGLLAFKESGNSLSNRVLGIDAASSEIGCRPEVFAQAFRLFKNYEPKQMHKFWQKEPYIKPGITYHVGEDFLDLVDGLRAIDEAIKFLNLSQGDRIGHALALGVYPKEYYKSKGNILVMPAQDLLDNAVWMYNQMRKFNIYNTQVEKILEKVFFNLYKTIYGTVKVNNEPISPCMHTYYDAWKLRGDNPEMIRELSFAEEEDLSCNCDILKERAITIWDYYAHGLRDNFDQRIYNDKKALKLCESYHFNYEVKVRGSVITEFVIVPGYIKVVEEIQNCLQMVVEKKNIGIEANPTSNVLIGTFKDYSTHPIFRWYNLGLTCSQEEIKTCPQMYVSINTDDQGVFNTYLENEYALLAQTLERQKDEDGRSIYKESMIYDWLENLRKMGIQQSFSYKKRI